ncbi:hypothetical protein M8494_00380 [Serratia ureilytica]
MPDYRRLFSAIFHRFSSVRSFARAGRRQPDADLVAICLERLNRKANCSLTAPGDQSQLSQATQTSGFAAGGGGTARHICCWMNGPRIRIRNFGALSIVNYCRALRAMGKTVFAISHDDHHFEHADRLLEMRSDHLRELTGGEREPLNRDSNQQNRLTHAGPSETKTGRASLRIDPSTSLHFSPVSSAACCRFDFTASQIIDS